MNLQDFRKELIEEAKSAAAADGGGATAAFVATAAGYLVQAESLPDFVPAFYTGRGKNGRKIRIDGYVLDEFDFTLTIVVAGYSGSPDEWTLTRTEADELFGQASTFVNETYTNQLEKKIEISTPAADLVDLLLVARDRVRKYRLLLLTDGVMSGRIESLPIRDIAGVPAECQIWDVARLFKVCGADAGREEIEIDFTEYTPRGLPCLETSDGTSESYRCYLSVIPGKVLADIYDRYGSQLLEGNVRSFLSTKVAVNKKIRETILTAPRMFFAFNNGVSATALDVKVETHPEGRFLRYARDFQIINGGQTTASLSNARFKDKADLTGIAVQMKLTEIRVDKESAHETVQKIARSSNSQNKVSDADFFSTHPFHVRMEQISRRLFAPPKGGAQYDTHWFYERARGQYLQEQMRKSPSERKKYVTQNPKEQVITKTDLAKVLNTWRGYPHVVSKGAQTNFAEFAQVIDAEWAESSDSFHERYFQEAVALMILFKHVERLVSSQAWYQQGYRANIVTYSVALLKYLIGKQFKDRTFDLKLIWNRQEVPEIVSAQLTVIAKAVMETITDPNRPVVNVTQWCKREECWKRVKALSITLNPKIAFVLIDPAQIRAEGLEARQDQEVASDLEVQKQVLELEAKYWIRLHTFIQQKKLRITADETMALRMACQIPARLPSAFQARRLLALASRCRQEGFIVE